MTKFITAKFTFTPMNCKCCGTEKSRTTLPIIGICPAYLNLIKQRFFCRACNDTFSASTSIVDDHCFISNQTKAKALIKSIDEQSLQNIYHLMNLNIKKTYHIQQLRQLNEMCLGNKIIVKIKL